MGKCVHMHYGKPELKGYMVSCVMYMDFYVK